MSPVSPPRLRALVGLDPDLGAALLAQVRDLWTHGSTALEGNTLTPRALETAARALQAARG